MNTSLIWKLFLAIASLLVLWNTIGTIRVLYHDLRLSHSVWAESVEWSAKEVNDERFALLGRYHYRVGGNLYTGEELLLRPRFWNLWAAEDSIAQQAHLSHRVWYSSTEPQYSALQKNFPIKECLSTALLWGLLGYFVCLRKRVQKLT